MRITGDSGVSVELEPLKWQFPADAGEWDDQWLVIRGRIDLGNGNWSFTDPCLLMTDARELARWLRAASDGRIGVSQRDSDGKPEPDLVFLEPALGFSVAEYQETGPVVCIHFAAEAAPPWLRATDPHLARFAVARTALGPVDRPDVRGMPDGTLLHLRDTYPIETAWAPQWTGDELRQARTGAWDARLAAIRATAEAAAAARQARHEEAARQQGLAASYQAMHQAYQQREAALAAVMADRAQWEEATRQQRHLALAADAELRRRHPDQPHPPLRSAEPHPAPRDHHDQPVPTAQGDLTRTAGLIAALTVQRRHLARQFSERTGPVPLASTSARAAPGLASLARTAEARDAILQPPKPSIDPSPSILERATSHDLDLEAAN